MTIRDKIKRYALVALVGLLSACQSAANAGLDNRLKVQAESSTIAYGQAHKKQSSSRQEQLQAKILNQVVAQHQSLGICKDSFNLEQSKVESKLYPTADNQYLVQILCFQAAYQGNYAFAIADLDQDQVSLTPLNLSLAGYPSYDPNIQILSNSYKFRGIGDCIENTEHRWTGHDLQLLTSELVEQLPDSCEIFKGGDSYRITPSRIGVAHLGMTLAELRVAMGDLATYTPVTLGVDLGMGLEVSNGGEVQFEVGSGSDSPMQADSVISFIRVSNPFYKTEEGIGPGTPLKQAIEAYGPATLSLNAENESREFVTFEQRFPQNVWIRSNQWALDGEAGVYPTSDTAYRTTKSFKEKAAIGAFTITLRN